MFVNVCVYIERYAIIMVVIKYHYNPITVCCNLNSFSVYFFQLIMINELKVKVDLHSSMILHDFPIPPHITQLDLQGELKLT